MKVEAGANVKNASGTAKVLAISETRVQIRNNDGDRVWIDRADFNATWKIVERTAA